MNFVNSIGFLPGEMVERWLPGRIPNGHTDAMNQAYFNFQIGKISPNELYHTFQNSQFEKLLNSQPSSYTHSKSSLNVAVSSIAVDDIGQFLLSSGDDGSLTLWGIDHRLKKRELCNKRLHFAKGKSRDDSAPTNRIRNTTRNYSSIGSYYNARLSNSTRQPQTLHSKVKVPLYKVPGMSREMMSYVHNKTNQPPTVVKRTSSTLERQKEEQDSHSFAITSIKWYSHDNGMFFTGSSDREVKIWDTNEFEVVQNFQLGYRVNQLDTKGDLVIVASEDTYPRVIDLKSMSSVISLGVKNKKMKFGINTAKFAPMGTDLVASGDDDGNVRIWDLRKSNSMLYDLTEQDTLSKPHAKCCNDLCWNPRLEDELVTTGNDGKCKLWSWRNTSEPRCRLQLGDTNLMRNKYRMRTSHRLMWHDRYVFFNSDYGEILLFRCDDGKVWNKFDYPLITSETRKTPRFQSMALETSMSNGIGMRLYLGTNDVHGQILEYQPS